MNKSYFKILAVGFLLVIVFWLSVVDLRPYIITVMKQQDKMYHLVFFTLFMLFSRWAFPLVGWVWLSFFGLGFGLMIEILQKFASMGIRQFNLDDLLFNFLGILIGLGFLFIFRKNKFFPLSSGDL